MHAIDCEHSERKNRKRCGVAHALLFVVGMLCWTATLSCVVTGTREVATVSQQELLDRMAAGNAPLILDVRSEREYKAGHLRGAVHIPHDELQGRVAELAAHKDQEIIVYCRSGARASAAEAVLREAGFTKVRDLDGHILLWQKNGHPLE